MLVAWRYPLACSLGELDRLAKLSTTPATHHFLGQPSKRSKRIDLDPPLSTLQVAYYDTFAMAAWPLEKIEPECEKVVDDATDFPKSMQRYP